MRLCGLPVKSDSPTATNSLIPRGLVWAREVCGWDLITGKTAVSLSARSSRRRAYKSTAWPLCPGAKFVARPFLIVIFGSLVGCPMSKARAEITFTALGENMGVVSVGFVLKISALTLLYKSKSFLIVTLGA